MTTIPIEASSGPRATWLQRSVPFLAAHRNLYDVLKSAAQVFLIRIMGAALTYASMVYLARQLGAFDFGIYAYVFVIVTVFAMTLSCGLNASGLRFVPDYLARKKWARLSGFMNQSFRIVLTFSALGALLGASAVLAFRGVIEPYYFTPLLVGMLCVPLWALLNQFETTARAFGWVHLAYIPSYVLRPFLLMAGIGGWVLSGGTPNAAAALWAMLAACSIAALGQGILVFAGARRRMASAKPVHHTRHWLTVSLSFLMIDGFRMLLDNTDVLVIGRLLDPHSVAVYFAAIRTGGLVAFVSFSMIALAVPKFASIHTTGTREDLQKFVSGVIQLMFWPSLLTAAVLAVLGPYILSLFGAGFAEGYPTMLVVLGGLVLRSATGPIEYLLNMTGHHRDTLWVYGFAALANIVLSLLLVPAFGIIGAAIATYMAMLSGNVCLYLLARKRLGLHAFVFRIRGRADGPTAKLSSAVRHFP